MTKRIDSTNEEIVFDKITHHSEFRNVSAIIKAPPLPITKKTVLKRIINILLLLLLVQTFTFVQGRSLAYSSDVGSVYARTNRKI